MQETLNLVFSAKNEITLTSSLFRGQHCSGTELLAFSRNKQQTPLGCKLQTDPDSVSGQTIHTEN